MQKSARACVCIFMNERAPMKSTQRAVCKQLLSTLHYWPRDRTPCVCVYVHQRGIINVTNQATLYHDSLTQKQSERDLMLDAQSYEARCWCGWIIRGRDSRCWMLCCSSCAHAHWRGLRTDTREYIAAATAAYLY